MSVSVPVSVRVCVLVFLCINACTVHDFTRQRAPLPLVGLRVNGASMDYILSWTGSGARAVRDAISSRIWTSAVREVHFTDYSELSHGPSSVQTPNTGLTTFLAEVYFLILCKRYARILFLFELARAGSRWLVFKPT